MQREEDLTKLSLSKRISRLEKEVRELQKNEKIILEKLGITEKELFTKKCKCASF